MMKSDMDRGKVKPTFFNELRCLGRNVERQTDSLKANPKTPVQNPQGVEKSVGQEAHGNRTPQLEDFGLSQGTLKFLESVAVVKRGPTNNAVQEKKPEPRRAHDPNIPSFFQHNGIITTPSLTRDLGIMDSTINHAALASPIISSQSSGDSWEFNKQPFPVSNLKFDENNGSGTTPQTPVLRTPGFREKFTNAQAHNNLTYSCAQSHEEQGYSHKRPVNVGLFKPATQSSVKGKLPVKDDGFPQSPELTYSLEEISEMTGVFKINPVAPPPPVLSSLQSGADKENATPPEPELLSERISRIKQADKIRTI
ncbi:hypothetical protein MAR_018692 [Mya arenaria]|uniref:Uncharacterized protein n=1 Tax=Mya arenaria TaxID=6604 RepID=A0ABY7EK09_MYAAR|nr:hypothetical protein MAR_018692 [Mya arenaria]